MRYLGITLLIFKLGAKVLPVILKLAKSAKVIKVGLAGASLAAYSYMFTWQFALILLFAIMVHEMGHVYGMKQKGIQTKGFYFIPFLGGAAVPSEAMKSYDKEAYISLMGPVFGILSIIPFIVLYNIDPNPLWAGVTSFIALVNVFNLLPINPLDGGRVIKSISFSINNKFGMLIVGLGMFLAMLLVFFMKIYLLLFMIIIGALEVFGDYKTHQNKLKESNALENGYGDNEYMSKDAMIKYTFVYLTLIAIFIGIIYFCSDIPGADIALKILQDKEEIVEMNNVSI